jgi:hypothetical protein
MLFTFFTDFPNEKKGTVQHPTAVQKDGYEKGTHTWF